MLEGGSTCARSMSSRYVLAYLSFFGFSILYMIRACLSVALLAMVKDNGNHSTNEQAECQMNNSTPNFTQNHYKGPQYDWGIDLQSQILGSFSYGYMISQLPGGWLAGKYGGKKVFGFGALCSIVLTILTPLAVQWSVRVFIAVRIIEGIGEGVTIPVMHALLAKWAPPLEKTKLASICYAGMPFGTVIGLPLSSYISSQLGWTWVFYIFGAFGLIWFVLWTVIASDSPSVHKRIELEEKIYIMSEISSIEGSPEPAALHNTPWLQIAKSTAVWAIVVVHFASNWGFYTLLMTLPRFLKDVLQFDLSEGSFVSVLPAFFLFLVQAPSGYIIDVLREKNILTTSKARKLAVAIGLLVAASCLVGGGYVGCNYTLAIALLCTVGAFHGLSQNGFLVNHLDIAPKYAGTLMGVTNTIATIPGFLAPIAVSWYTSKESTSATWRNIFYTSFIINSFGVIIFVMMGKGDVQWWATSFQSYRTVINQDGEQSVNGAEGQRKEKVYKADH